MRLLGEPDDLDRVGQRAGERLVDEDRLVRPEDRPDLLQVGPAVDALQEHHVDPRQQVVDRIDDLDLELVAQLRGEAGDAVAARGDVGTPPGIRGDDPDPRQVALRLRRRSGPW